MDIFWIILSGIIILIGIAGAILPGIPGPAFSFGGLLVSLLSHSFHLSPGILITLGVAALVITVIDYLIPAYGTKKSGGTKAGITGSIVGLIAGLLFMPGIGIIIGPFAGAFVAEIIAGSGSKTAFRSATGAFLGFLAGSFMKLMYGFIILIYYVVGLT